MREEGPVTLTGIKFRDDTAESFQPEILHFTL